MFSVNRYIPGQDSHNASQVSHQIRLRKSTPTSADTDQHDRIPHRLPSPKTVLAPAEPVQTTTASAKTKTKKSKQKQKPQKHVDDDNHNHILVVKPKSKSKSKKRPVSEMTAPDEQQGQHYDRDQVVADLLDHSETGSSLNEAAVTTTISSTADPIAPSSQSDSGGHDRHPHPGPARPAWLRSDRVVVIPDQSEDVALDGLEPALAQCLRDRFRITSLFPMQSFLMGAIDRDRRLHLDSCISSPTGSGKTLAFALPIVQQLAWRVVTHLRALILVPTRDLAVQLRDVVGVLAGSVGLRTGLAIGQRSFEFEQSELMADAGVDILICTPGRLTDHLQLTPGFTLKHLEYLVLDEADRLFGQNFQSWEMAFQRGRAVSCSSLQTLLFSATMSLNPLSLAKLQLRSPIFYCRTALNDYACAASLTQQIRVCQEPIDKLTDLIWILRRHRSKTIVFLNALDVSHNLKRTLEIFGEFAVEEFHSGLRQKQRLRVMASFKSSCDHVLICSDVMARGIDIEGVEVVINFDCPNFLRTYLHRVGRTARANKAGLAVTLCLPHEVRHFRGLLRHAENHVLEKITIPATERAPIQEALEPCIQTAQLLFDAELRHQFDRFESIRTSAHQSVEDIQLRLQKLMR